jgi:hypothetical protein
MRTIYLLLAQNMSEASWNEIAGLGLPPWRHKEWSTRGLTKDVLNGTTESLFRVLKVLSQNFWRIRVVPSRISMKTRRS